MINSVTMATIYGELIIIDSHLHLHLLFIVREVSGWTMNDTITDMHNVTSYKGLQH